MFRKFAVFCFFFLGVMFAHAGDIAEYVTNAEAGEPADCPSGVDNQSPQGPANPQANPYRGNPINVGTGNKFHKESVYVGAGEFPLEYSLYYNSRHRRPDAVTGRWTTSYSQYGYHDRKNNKISLFREDGQEILFEVGQPSYSSDSSTFVIGKNKSIYADGRIAFPYSGLHSPGNFKIGDYVNLVNFRVDLTGGSGPITPWQDLSGPHEIIGFSVGFMHVRRLAAPWPTELAERNVVTSYDDAKIVSAQRGSATTSANQFKATGSLSYTINRFGSGTTADPYRTFFRDYMYTRPDGYIETYDAKGLLVSIESPTGLKHSISRTIRTYQWEWQPYLGLPLCKAGRYSGGSISWVISGGAAVGGSQTVKFFNSGGGETVASGSTFQCTDTGGPSYINWACKKNSASSPGYYNCATFAHKTAKCLDQSSSGGSFNVLIPNSTGGTSGGSVSYTNTSGCSAWEEIIEGESGVKFDMDVTVTDSYGNALSWTEKGSSAISVGGVCDGCANTAITTPVGQFVFAKTSEGLIKSITSPGVDGGRKEFLYELNDSSFAGGCSIFWKCKTALTGIIDEENRRFATWEYLNITQSQTTSDVHMARAYKSFHGTGSEIDEYYEVEYTDGHNRKVTNRQGHAQVLNFNAADGYIKLDNVTGSGGTNCKNTAATYSYNTKKQIQKITYEGKFTFDYTYYTGGRIESITEAKGTDQERKAVYVWEPTVKRGLKSIALYEKTQAIQLVEFFYWPNGRLKERSVTDLTNYTVPYATNGRKLTTTYTYDYWSGSKIKTLTINGPRTDVVDQAVLNYDDKGRLTKVQNALGHSMEFKNFNVAGMPATFIDENGVSTQLAFNFRNQLTFLQVGDALYYVAYYKNGLPQRVVYTGGGAVNFEYTSARNLKAVYDELGNRMEVSRTIDATDSSLLNVVTLIKTGLGEERFAEKIQLDALGRVYKWFGENKNIYVDRFDYDAAGNLAGVNNGGVYNTTASIDKLGRLDTVTNSDAGLTTYKYNAFDQLTSVSDPRQLSTVYTVDGFGRVIQQSSPDTGKTIYHYDPAGNVTRKIDNANRQTDFRYDSLNRLTDIIFAGNQGQNIVYRYDNTSGDSYGKGRLTSTSVGSGNGYSYIYDQKGLLDRKITLTGAAGYAWEYDYDAMGRMTSLRYPSGRLLTYSRDIMGKITQIVSTYAGVDEAIAQSVVYEPFGPLKSFYYGNGVKHETTYNKAYWPTAIENFTVQKDSLGYYNSGLLRQTDVQYGSADDMWYYFDDGARLENVVATGWNTEFVYDRSGNRDKKVTNDSVAGTTRTLDTVIDPLSNRIKNITGINQPDWQYTLTGQLSGKPASNEIFVYGDNDRLKNYQGPAGSAEYEYGPFGERMVKKTTGGNSSETHYAYEGPTLLAEFDGTGKMLREYFYADGHLIGMYELTDKDGDKMDDGWEKAAFGDLSHGVSADSDGDGLTDSEEFQAGLDPLNSVDSDADAMPDDWEQFYFGTLSRNGSGDLDKDGTTDLAEYQRKSRPNLNDVAWMIPIIDLIMR